MDKNKNLALYGIMGAVLYAVAARNTVSAHNGDRRAEQRDKRTRKRSVVRGSGKVHADSIARFARGGEGEN